MKQLLLIIVVFVLAGCVEDTPAIALTAEPIINLHGQTITHVENRALHGWLKEHRKVKIISISQISKGEGQIGGFLVVYESKAPNVE